MFDSEADKSYKSMWKHRKFQSKMDMLRRLISLGVILQLIANIGEFFKVFSYFQLQINLKFFLKIFTNDVTIFLLFECCLWLYYENVYILRNTFFRFFHPLTLTSRLKTKVHFCEQPLMTILGTYKNYSFVSINRLSIKIIRLSC